MAEWSTSFHDPVLIDSGDRLLITIARMSQPDVPIVRIPLEPDKTARLLTNFQFQIAATYITDPVQELPDGSFNSMDDMLNAFKTPSSLSRFYQIQPWRDIEEIAAHVEGDSTDPMRIALADSIRQCQRHVSNMEKPK